ncbi:MAG: AAA family ATPase [Vicinamibacterales bacterium]
MDTDFDLRTFLRDTATPALIGVISEAIARAEAANTGVYLSHLVDRLVEEESIRLRVDDDVRRRARVAIAEQLASLPSDPAPGRFAFQLPALAKPALSLARDSGAAKVSPVVFLAACLSPRIELDPISARTQEVCRSVGLTHESLAPAPDREAVRRADFTLQSLGFGTDVTAMARAGFWRACPLFGMGAELRRLAVVLSSMSYSAAVVGEPGVGKSAFIQGFAWHIVHKTRPLIPTDMDGWTVVMVEAADVMRGTSGRGDLETRVKEMLTFFRKNPTIVPFFEEVHRLLDTDDPASRSVATALKPPMAYGLFRCVGVTTDKEYSRFIASDEAMSSRFRKILLPEPDEATAIEVIRGAKANLLSSKARDLGIAIDDGAIETSVRVTSTYQKADRLPRKAINLIGEAVTNKIYDVQTAGSAESVSRTVTGHDVALFFSEVTGIPVDDLVDDRDDYYERLAQRLSTQVHGQDHAVDAVTSWLALHASGWVDARRPRGRFLFLGPPGVGKTELAMSIAGEVMRDRGSVITLNMGDFKGESARNKFVGADPGYIGFGQTPTIFTRVLMRPYSVVVLDEIEKADPSLADVLLAVLDGRGEDSQGRAVDFSQCIFVMTSNAVYELPELARDAAEGADNEDQILRAALTQLGGIWTPPLVDRLDRIALFRPLSGRALEAILEGMIAARRQQSRRPLPSEIDVPRERQGILASASDSSGTSARRLERALQQWLSARAKRRGDAAAAPHTSTIA